MMDTDVTSVHFFHTPPAWRAINGGKGGAAWGGLGSPREPAWLKIFLSKTGFRLLGSQRSSALPRTRRNQGAITQMEARSPRLRSDAPLVHVLQPWREADLRGIVIQNQTPDISHYTVHRICGRNGGRYATRSQTAVSLPVLILTGELSSAV